MATEDTATTTTGSLVQPTSLPNSDPTENERKLMILLRLGSHFWPKDFTKTQAKEFLRDYIEDLAKYTPPELEAFAGTWRRDVARTKFPKIGDIVFGVERARADASVAASWPKGRVIPGDPDKKPYPDHKSRPILWWMQPKELWNPVWKEDEVPQRELIRDNGNSHLREPVRSK